MAREPELTPEQLRRVDRLSVEALERPTEERQGYVERHCGDDARVRAEVLSLILRVEEQLRQPEESGAVPDARLRALLAVLAEVRAGESRYTRVGQVARGGMGAILLVRDHSLERPLAMKVLREQAEVTDAPAPPPNPRALARFLAEARVTGQLDHPGIVPVHDLGLDADGRVYFTMKLVRGQPLDRVYEELARGEQGWNQTRVLGLLLRVCEALSYAHEKGVIHRDLKPANVMVGRFGEVYVMDWGVAKVLGDAEPDPPERAPIDEASATLVAPWPPRTSDGEVLGTPAYMAPEQARGHASEVGPAADVYALGAMLYQLLAGRMPYVEPGERPSSRKVWYRAISGPPASLHEIAPEVPSELVAICEKAMAREPAGRYANTSELAEDLSAYIEGRVVRAYEAGAWAEARKWVRRNVSLALALCAALLLALGGLASTSYVQASGRTRAEAETAKVLRLSDAKVLADLDQIGATLWPPDPALLSRLEEWLDRARTLAARLPLHRATLEDLRARAEVQVAADGSREWTFTSDEDRWQHDLLAELTRDLEHLSARLAPLGDEAPPQPWSVLRRAEFARELQAGFAAEGAHARAWAEAREPLAAAYPGLDLAPQLGLLPLGPDPESGLWEFAHLASGDAPARDSEGRLVLNADSGLVLVLIPGGSDWLGAQAADPDAPNYDPLARGEEGPPHEVVLSPFFLGKHELTLGQWQRLTGALPNFYDETRVDDLLRHPVEMVSWDDCAQWLPRFGLALPSEAQWEYAARAGSDGPWWTGHLRESLRGRNAANLADATAARAGAPWRDIADWPEFDDGHAAHAPVGSFTPNPFGLHDVIGNVFEWVADGNLPGFFANPPRLDPLAPTEEADGRIARGGAYNRAASVARASQRVIYPPTNSAAYLGVRAARALEP